ncbi:MAG: metal-dependent hydrolase [Brockia lithotrophica]|nr:metal-dependent hydrolase [Brockia lithotrophica]
MMMGTTHALVGFAAGFFLTQDPIVGAAAAGFAALLPDIDHPDSILGSRVRVASHIFQKVFGHRSFTHSLLALFLVSFLAFLLAAWISNEYPAEGVKIFEGYKEEMYVLPPLENNNFASSVFWGTLVGYASHIILDMVSGGVSLFWPSRKKIGVSLIRTGSLAESLFNLVFAVALVAYVVYRNGT